MNGERQLEAVAQRLSLRAPQKESLAILARVCELVPLEKSPDLQAALGALANEFPQVTSFERDFPSLCFALATGVGKTRLMGAFIAWLHRAQGIENFFVLAPNLTIYEKLIRDFTPNTPKYVFTGLAEFATAPPVLVTGEDYEQGHGVRLDTRGTRQHRLFAGSGGPVHVNVFNISKINAEVRGGKSPRIKRLAEYIGQSYFEYLSELPDLVLLMDESHRYRASAGVRAINELRPVLGLELTATPQVQGGTRSEPFRNVIYSYPLANALKDGFVKEPAVATRQDFDARDYDEQGLERLKLEDGVRIHEATKVELEIYARNRDERLVKPFLLVVAVDTQHADSLQALIESPEFFDGRYQGKVITVHSNQRGEEKDELVEQLLSVEDPSNPVEVVIHVNMLKEGWDVTNLYTIVPLRAASSRTLVEQSIGRGLRLPYGKRTGEKAVDRLTIVAHDKFQEIVDHANDPDSIIRQALVIGRDILPERTRVEIVEPSVCERLFGVPSDAAAGRPATTAGLFDSPRQHDAARRVLEILPEFERLASSKDLTRADVRKRIEERVRETLSPEQADFTRERLDLGDVVRETVEAYVARSIDIPRVLVVPKGELRGRFQEFALDLAAVHFQPVAKDILIRHLSENVQYTLASGDGVVPEATPEDYLVNALMDFDDVSYDDNAEALYSLSAQVVEHLRGYLGDDEDSICNVLQYHQRTLAELVHAQMQAHYVAAPVEYEVRVSKGFVTLRESRIAVPEGEETRDFRAPVSDRQRIRQMVFGGFEKSIYLRQQFHSDSERRFAVVLENDAHVLKWLKPIERQILIDLPDGTSYLPDFVVETGDSKVLCEVKAASELRTEEVDLKTRAAVTWCRHATAHAIEHGTKPWSYLVIPHDEIGDHRSWASLAASCGRTDVRSIAPRTG